MKLAHIAVATPRKCGLYETTRELVAAERELGVDARIVDPKPVDGLHPGESDRGVPMADMDWAVTADVIISHSGHDGTPVAETNQPIIHVAHGRPHHSWLGEAEGGTPVYTYNLVRSRQERYKCCVTFWPEHKPYWDIVWGGKPVHVTPAPVDRNHWCPGPSQYKFAGKGGDYNVVMTDPWCRNDMTPFHVMHAFAHFRKRYPGARLHLYAVDPKATRGLRPLRAMLGKGLGVVQGWAADLRSVYRAADMLVTSHRIATRSVREALACGCQVVKGPCYDLEQFADQMARAMQTSTPGASQFDVAMSAKRMIGIAEEYAGVTVGN